MEDEPPCAVRADRGHAAARRQFRPTCFAFIPAGIARAARLRDPFAALCQATDCIGWA